ncbi:MAG: hypothetical protein A2086_15500 [Spirochaetes bacterium GWD1_27_9]|nr:MAG: hypothetical protein A2Z98_14945 [Spirochaetes bacterium GWB1_27_13]OHD23535.1 MAG: hypothetical protein A2Y34_05035 [Spirochaetes bacterium GWC1_27_15]OHD42788.1 MAG: hypothetical protein A2086_15500 [Spirochaetes bacterium GWD1_27_9]
MIKSKSIKRKILFSLSIILLLTFSYITINSTILLVENGKKEIKNYRDSKMSFYKDKLKSMIDIAYEILKTNKSDAEIFDAIRLLRYDNGTGYFWINDDREPYPVMLMHPITPVLENNIMNDPKYDNIAFGGKENLFTSFVKIAKQSNEGYIDYIWTKPNEKESKPKLSYIKYLKEKKWIIGTGFYIDDIEIEIKKIEADINIKIKNDVIKNILSFILIFSAVFIIIYLTIDPMTKSVHNLTNTIMSASLNDLTVRFPMKKISCSKIKNCGNETCQEYDRDEVKCFIDVGSYAPDFGEEIKCKSILEGAIKDCSHCKVYKKLCDNEINQMGALFNKFIEKIQQIVNQINLTSSTILHGAKEITKSSINLSEQSKDMLNSLQNIASTIDTMANNIKQNTDNSIECEKTSLVSSNSIKQGGDAVKETVDSINKIPEIIKAITEIANVTNMLSINASIEAARAGEHGEGFSVVATEVKKLSERSIKSALEIQKFARSSVEIANKATNLISAVIPEIVKTSNIVQQIAHSSKEQEQFINNLVFVSKKEEDLAHTVSANSEELTAVAEEMEGLAKDLFKIVSEFKLD